MHSPRFKTSIFKFKLQQQKRRQNLSCSPDTVQCSTHISSSRSQNELILYFVGKLRQFSRTFIRTICSNSDVSNDILFGQEDKGCHQVKEVATHSTISHQINSFEFQPIKGGIFHTFRHLGFQIKIIFLLSFFVFCNVQVLFHVIFSLISCLCFSFPFLLLVTTLMFLSCLFKYVLLIHYV